jgi:hypothetical protein
MNARTPAQRSAHAAPATPLELAGAFLAVARDDVTLQDWTECLRPGTAWALDGFVDADHVMARAFRRVTGRTAPRTSADGTDDDHALIAAAQCLLDQQLPQRLGW